MDEILTDWYTPARIQPGGSVLRPPLVLREAFDTGEKFADPPVVRGGRLYCGTLPEDRWCCHDEGTLRRLWSGPVRVRDMGGVFAGERVVMTALSPDLMESEMVTLNLADGGGMTRLGRWGAVDPVMHDGRIYYRARASEPPPGGGRTPAALYCRDGATFDILWQRGPVSWGSSIALGGRYLLLAELGALYRCFDCATGDLLWRVAPLDTGLFKDEADLERQSKPVTPEEERLKPDRVSGYPVIFGDIAVVPMFGNHLVGLELATGATKWSVKLTETCTEDRHACGSELFTYLDGRWEVHDLATGTRLRAFRTDPVSLREATRGEAVGVTQYSVSQTHVFVMSMSTAGRAGWFYSVEQASGRVEWAFRTTEMINEAQKPYVANGRFYARTGGHLYVFEGADGYLG